MLRILIAVIWIYICYRLGKWRKWKLFYPTVLYYCIADLTCSLLTFKKPLWLLGGAFWNHTFAEYFITFTIFPCIIIVFLSNYPSGIRKQLVYISFFVFQSALTEYIFFITGGIRYYNGWNLLWTIFRDFIMYSLVRLHYRNPLVVWPISILLAFTILYIFKIPISSLR